MKNWYQRNHNLIFFGWELFVFIGALHSFNNDICRILLIFSATELALRRMADYIEERLDD